MGSARPANARLASAIEGHRPPFLPDRDHLRHRVAHITRQVLHLLRVATKVRRVVGEVRVAALHDHPLQVVEVRVQAVRQAEPDGVGGDVRGERPVPDEASDAATERRPGDVGPRAGRRHLADGGALVAHHGVDEPQPVREHDRGRRHAPGREVDAHARVHGRADRGDRAFGERRVRVDEGPVDVEREEPDRERGLGPDARAEIPHRPAPRPHEGRSTRARRGSPARSGCTTHGQPG